MSAPENTLNQEFTAEEMCKIAQLNANGFALLTLAYLKEQGQSTAEWVGFIGRRVSSGWDDLKGNGARAVARVAALNVVSVGGTLQALSGDDVNAEAVVGNWPTQENLEFVGLTRADAVVIFDAIQPIASDLGLRFAWQDDGNQVRLRFSQ